MFGDLEVTGDAQEFPLDFHQSNVVGLIPGRELGKKLLGPPGSEWSEQPTEEEAGNQGKMEKPSHRELGKPTPTKLTIVPCIGVGDYSAVN